MKFARLIAVFCAFLLAACAPQGLRLVDTKDDASFATMYRAMKPAMLQKKMVANDGSWYTPLIDSGPDDAGLRLVDALSPKFLGTEWNDPTTKVFRDILSPWDKLSVGPYSATLRMSRHRIKLQLTAVTDWNEDGKDDHLSIKLICCIKGRLVFALFPLYAIRNNDIFKPRGSIICIDELSLKLIETTT